MPVTDDAGLLRSVLAGLSGCALRRVAVAVSGGSDSLACLHLLRHLADQQGWALLAVTVDHALRPESAAEAQSVGQTCRTLGIAHQTLVWNHGAVTGNLMDAARRARYALMADWAGLQRIDHIILGHTADDQAETFLMGLARGAGLDGLTGMRPFWDQGGVRFVRPLLDLRRDDLRACLTRRGQAWVDDPSNSNERFHRVKARRALKALKPLGITTDRLLVSMQNLAQAQQAVQQAVSEAAARACRETAGDILVDGASWAALPPEIRRRLLISALLWISGADYPPRSDAIARLEAAIAAGKPATLWGCRVRPELNGFRVQREFRAVRQCKSPVNALWDGRWQLEGPQAPGLEIRALGAAGLPLCKAWRRAGLPRETLVATPAIWYGESLIAAPLAGFGADWTARIVAGFSVFVLSH